MIPLVVAFANALLDTLALSRIKGAVPNTLAGALVDALTNTLTNTPACILANTPAKAICERLINLFCSSCAICAFCSKNVSA